MMDNTEATVRNMLAAIEAPLYDVGVLSDRGMLPGLDAIPASTVSQSCLFSSTAMPAPPTFTSALPVSIATLLSTISPRFRSRRRTCADTLAQLSAMDL